MRNSNRTAPVTGRTGKRVLGVAVAGGAVVFVLAGGGVAMAGTLHGHAPADRIGGRPGLTHVTTAHGGPGLGKGRRSSAPANTPGQGQPGWDRVSNTPGTVGGKTPGATTTTGQGQPGWNRVSNTPGAGAGAPGATSTPGPVTTGGTGGQGAPGSTPTTPAPVTTGGHGGNGGPGGITPGGQGGNGGPGGITTGGQGGAGGQGGNAGLGA